MRVQAGGHTIALTVDDNTNIMIASVAKQYGMNRSQVVRMALQEMFNDIEDGVKK